MDTQRTPSGLTRDGLGGEHGGLGQMQVIPFAVAGDQ